MNDIDKMPSKCRDCPYWERAAEPYVCCDCTTPVKKCGGDYILRSDALNAISYLPEPYTGAFSAIRAIPAADVEPKRRWIPVTEKTPEGRQYVLCCGAKGGMFVGWVCDYHERDNGKATAFLHGGHGRKITHWMPLPEPPEGEEDAD